MRVIALSILLLSLSYPSQGTVSNNVPLDHWSYQDMDVLIGQGLLQSDMMSTRPISRLEMARLIVEAQASGQDVDSAKQVSHGPLVDAILARLQHEFLYEVNLLESGSLTGNATFIKPLEDPTYRLVYARRAFDPVNQYGEHFDKGSNNRMGFIARGVIADRFAFYLHPEFKSPSSSDSGVTLRESYAKTQIGCFEIQFGKDSFWWGPGYRGSLILSNNMDNLTGLKISNPTPILLPGILKGLGPFKMVYFLSELEEDRTIPKAKFTGVRLSVKPRPNLEIGGARTIMFGGQGVPSIGLDDYLQIFWPKNIQGYENQFASFDVSWRSPLPQVLPARSVRLYAEYGGEDAAGFHEYRPLLGMEIYDLFKNGRTNLQLEYGKTHIGQFPNVFYQHGIYQSGYTYKGRVMGHQMGTNARDVFARLTHYLTPDLLLGLDWDRHNANVATTQRPQTDQVGLDLMWFGPQHIQLQARYLYEDTQVAGSPLHGSNQILDLSLVYDF